MNAADGSAIIMGAVNLMDLVGLTGGIKNSEIALPEFQRPAVWKIAEKKELVVSLCMGIPIGSFLIWEYDFNHLNHKDTKIRAFTGQSLNKSKVKYILVDGQQRLNTLFSLVNSDFGSQFKVEFRQVKKGFFRPVITKIAIDKRTKLLDLESINEKCEIQIKELANLSVTGVINKLDDGPKKVAEKFRTSLKQTVVATHFFDVTKDRKWISFVYQVSNLAGKSLTKQDYAEAALSFVYPDLPEKVKSFVENSNNELFKDKINREFVYRCMLDDIYGDTRFDTCKKLGLDVLNPRIINPITKVEKQLTPNIVSNSLRSVKDSITKIIDLLKGSWKLDSSKPLLLNELLIMSSWYRANYPVSGTPPAAKEIGKMSKWMMISMALKPTTGGNTQKAATECCILARSSIDPWTDIKKTLGLRQLKPSDLGDSSKESSSAPKGETKTKVPTYSMIFHMFIISLYHSKAKDILDSSPINALTRKNLQIDHFYPKSKLKLIPSLKLRKDHLANYVLMKSWSNNTKQVTMPDEIIDKMKKWPKVVGGTQKDSFKAHCIPLVKSSGEWIKNADTRFNSLDTEIKIVKAANKKLKDVTLAKTTRTTWEEKKKTAEGNIKTLEKSLATDYTNFLNYRRKAMKDRINDYLNHIEKHGL